MYQLKSRIKVLLVCNAGMSTGIMQVKLEEEAKKQNVKAEILAIPISEIDDYLDGADCILLGPQVKFAEKDVKSMANEIPVFTIDSQDFGLMRADKVFKEIEKLLSE